MSKEQKLHRWQTIAETMMGNFKISIVVDHYCEQDCMINDATVRDQIIKVAQERPFQRSVI